MPSPTLPPHDVKSHGSNQVTARGEVHRALRASPYLALRALQVEHADGRLFLRGRVVSYYLKQVAQADAARAAAGHPIVNEIEVM